MNPSDEDGMERPRTLLGNHAGRPGTLTSNSREKSPHLVLPLVPEQGKQPRPSRWPRAAAGSPLLLGSPRDASVRHSLSAVFFCGPKGVGERIILAAEERRGAVEVLLAVVLWVDLNLRPGSTACACPDSPGQGRAAVVDMQEGGESGWGSFQRL